MSNGWTKERQKRFPKSWSLARRKQAESLRGKRWKKSSRAIENSKKAFGPTRFRKGITSWNKGMKFSDEWRRKLSESHIGKQRGPNSGRWKGGLTPLYNQIRNCFKYRQWRSDVFTRDDFTCQGKKCGIRGGVLHADHKKRFIDIIKHNKIISLEMALECEELWNINNGQTLCVPCHKKTDTFGSKKQTI